MWKTIGGLILVLAVVSGVSYKNFKSSTPEHKLICAKVIGEENGSFNEKVLKRCTFYEIVDYKITH